MYKWFCPALRLTPGHVLVGVFLIALTALPLRAFDCSPCSSPDDGSGTAVFPGPCPHQPCCGDVMRIIDGLPQGTTVDIKTEILPMSLVSSTPGGSLGGVVIMLDGVMSLTMQGTGGLPTFARQVNVPITVEIHTAPTVPGNPVQSFDTDMFRLHGQITGDPDFDLLRITAGDNLGLPSPGHASLTRRPGGDWSVDSFFDITYRIDFVGTPGRPLGGMSGSTTGTIRIYQGCPNWTAGDPSKMHFPQPPNETGWNVHATYPHFLADDFQCTETGPIKDIHFWGSWIGGQAGRISAFHLKIYSDVPKGVDAPYSHPGEVLWEGTFTEFVMTPIRPHLLEGWYDPNSGVVLPGDHDEYWQYDFMFSQGQWFEQQAGTVYWLSVSAEVEPGPVQHLWGWKSSSVHFNDDAVFMPDAPTTCTAPDNGFGTATMPAECPYTSSDFMMIIDGLPAGTTIQCRPTIMALGAVETPGGTLGGTVSQWSLMMTLEMTGTGALAGFSRTIPLPAGSGQSSCAPRSPGTSLQSFDSDLGQMQAQITGDPDFDLLRITGGTGFGLPSPGHTTLTSSGGGTWSVDSFFDITYRIDFVGHPASVLGGMSGSTTGTIRVGQGGGPSNPWRDLYEPPEFLQSLDLAFVITNGPGQSTGACCTPGGTCFVTTSIECEAQGGFYLGDGSACLGDADGDGVDDACAPAIVRGACCFPNGSCGVVTQDRCNFVGGLYLGDGTVCLGDNDADGVDDACERPPKRGACCWSDGSCSVVTQDKCVSNGGTYLGDGTPCLGDLNGNHVDDACERPEPDFKWDQLPDLEPTGMDVFASLTPDRPPFVLADDFLCTVTGPITKIHVFGSWYLDRLPFGDPRQVRFTLSIHSDIPAQAGGYSRPGELLCHLQDLPFTVKPYGVELMEGFMIPPGHWSPWPKGDRVCWEYVFHLPPDLCFQQGTAANPVVYWLDVQATPNEQGTYFGWKTTREHWNDDATYANGVDLPGAVLPWQELIYPANHPFGGQSIDLAFKILGHNGTPPTGACCWPDGSCSVVTQANCEHTITGVIGTYLGDGTLCQGDANNDGVDDACGQTEPTGACCFTGAAGPTCLNTTQADCILNHAGTWYAGQNCATFQCPTQPPQGACCYPDPAGVLHCVSTTHKECVKVFGGTWYLGQSCANIDCPTPQEMGACCYGDPANPMCVNTTHDLCKTQFNGQWYAGQDCATFDCPKHEELGACCFTDPAVGPSCVNTTKADCAMNYGGTWYAGQNCATFTCPNQVPEGACCYGDPASPLCVGTTQADCHAKYGGTWYAGQTCATIQCPTPPETGACCFLTAAGPGCVNTSQLDCHAVYGGTWYPGQSCATYQCPTPVPTGVCCFGTPPQCVSTTEDQCKSSYGGVWYPGQTCTTFQCVSSCCVGRVGDANGSGGDEPTIGDISVMIDAKFITGDCAGVIRCLAESDINQSGGMSPTCDDITIGDIAILIDYLFITGNTLVLPDCR